jgi:hypothetical protein
MIDDHRFSSHLIGHSDYVTVCPTLRPPHLSSSEIIGQLITLLKQQRENMSSSSSTNSKASYVTDPPQEVSFPAPRTLTTSIKHHLSRIIRILSYTPPIYLFARFITVFAPQADRVSKSNDLHFHFAHSNSPLRVGTHEVGITAGVLPKRFHAHNDCASFFTYMRHE